jgi:predicted nucleic acid-binding protein
MSLTELPSGTTVFVDASIFTYHFTGADELAQICSAFFERTVRGEVKAVTTSIVAMEVIHRAIVQEAAEKLDVSRAKLVQHLKENPAVVKSLIRHRTIPGAIYRLGVSIEPVTHLHVYESGGVREKYGLMANDSLTIAFMRKQNIRHLVTNDDDFAKIPNIYVWLPR